MPKPAPAHPQKEAPEGQTPSGQDEAAAAAAAALRPQHRRDEIMDVALGLFRDHGVAGVSTRQIAAAVGISQPSLYAHFPTKQALIEAAAVRSFDQLSASMQQVLDAAQSEGLDSFATMQRMARVYIDFALTHADAYRIALMNEYDAPGGRAPGPMLQAGYRAYSLHRDALARHLGGRLDAQRTEILSQSMWASLHGIVSLLIARPIFPWADREALIETHIRRILAEVAPPDSPSCNPGT